MPRQGVPYDGAENGCGIWCQIKQLWTIMRTKLKSINGVPGDGDGDVKLLAGTGVTINNDQLHNEITISAAGGSDDAVKSVNGTLPDSDGDVAINTGVLTLNNIAPDSDGDFTISAGSNITITPGTNEIEISASGGTPTAKSPIYIDGDGDICLKDWEVVDNTNWGQYIDANNYALKDLYLLLNDTTNDVYADTFIPKGTLITNGKLDVIAYSTSGKYPQTSSVDLPSILYNISYITVKLYYITVSSSGSSADNIINVSNTTFNRTINKKTINDPANAPGIRLLIRG